MIELFRAHPVVKHFVLLTVMVEWRLLILIHRNIHELVVDHVFLSLASLGQPTHGPLELAHISTHNAQAIVCFILLLPAE